MSNQAKIVLKGVDEFSKTFKAAESGLGGVEKTANAAGAAIRSMLGPITAGAALFAIQQMASNALKAGDDIAKLSTRLGASTEALSEYRLVAQKAGVDFKVLTLGWQRMTRRISEAANGTGEAKDALRELRLDAAKLNGLRPEQQFEALADALARVENPADRVRLAMKLFDSEGVALVQTMAQGAAGIREVRDQAKAAGMSMSAEAAKGAEDYANAMADLKAATQGAGEQLALMAAGALTSLVTALGDSAARAREFKAELEDIKNATNNAQDNREAWWGKFLGVDDTLLWALISEDWDKAKRILADAKAELSGAPPPKAAGVMDWSSWIDTETVDEAADAAYRLNEALATTAATAATVGQAMSYDDETAALLSYWDALVSVQEAADEVRARTGGSGSSASIPAAASQMSGALEDAARSAGYAITSNIGGALAGTKKQLLDFGDIARAVLGAIFGKLIGMGVDAIFNKDGGGGGSKSAGGGGAVYGPPAPNKALASTDLFIPRPGTGAKAAAATVGAPVSIGAMTVNLPNAYNLKDPMVRRQVAVDLYDELSKVGSQRGVKK